MDILRDRAAAALDATHEHDGRGPRTYGARVRIATALDVDGKILAADVRWLEKVAGAEK